MQSNGKGVALSVSESDENAVMTQILAIHAPIPIEEHNFEVESLLKVVRHIFHSLIPLILQVHDYEPITPPFSLLLL